MKNLKRVLALLLALILCFSCVSASEVEEHEHDLNINSINPVDPAYTEIVEAAANDRLTWELDGSTLWIGGQGSVKPFASADDQPWASVREQIEIVRFEEDARLLIDDIAYWFAGCINLTYADLPAYVFEVGQSAFQDCSKLEELGFYHEVEAPAVDDSAFSCTDGVGLTVISVDNTVATGLSRVNWSDRTADILDLSQYDFSTYDGPCGINDCYCTSCSYYNKIDDYDEYYHYRYSFCTVCDAKEWASVYRQEHTFNSSGYCTACGYEEVVECDHGRTYNEWEGCYYYTYCYYCDEYLGSGVSHGTYTYGSWSYYSTSQHRRYYSCSDCGEGTYQYGSHSTTTQYSNYSDTQHSIVKYCSTCSSNVGSTTYGSHSYTYDSWTSYSSSQHRRTKGCSYCTLSTYDYGTHADSNGDGKCDTCSYSMTVSVTWDAGSNGGTINGSSSVSTAVVSGNVASSPGTPVKTGHTFRGWYTAASSGSLYNTVTVTSARTFYAQFEAASYTVTWDMGNGSTETTQQTYGQPLLLPGTDPTNGNAQFDGWYTAQIGGSKVDENTTFTGTGPTTYYAHWIEVFSVTVPTNLPLGVDENGQVYSSQDTAIQNHSSGKVRVSSITLESRNGWQIVPYDTNMAAEQVDAKLVGFAINSAETLARGSSEVLVMAGEWNMEENSPLQLHYDAVVSALSTAVTDVPILTVVFILEWA